jgi:hypothetical protein
VEASPGYAWGQLVLARQQAAHAEPDVRARAAERIAKWERVLAGMRDGSIEVGSRTPTSAPPWVTLEVVKGGFATGGHAAGGPLLPHEVAMREQAGLPADAGRLALNLWSLESAELAARLESGRYRIDVPEEGALLVVAWLRGKGELAAASAVIEAIEPWLGALRFYPIPDEPVRRARSTSGPYDSGSLPYVRRQDLGTTLASLAVDRRQPQVEAMRETIRVWTPLMDQAIALALETVEGDAPRLLDDRVTGGWPCRSYPDGWTDRVRAHVAEYERLRGLYTLCKRPERGPAGELRGLLAKAAADPEALTGREVGRIRRIVAAHVTAHGVPWTESHYTKRLEQSIRISDPLHRDLREILVARLAELPRDAGIRDLDELAQPVTHAEAQHRGIPEDSALPPYLVDKLARSWEAPLDVLVRREVLPSSEVLARVLPEITAQVRTLGVSDPVLRRVYSAIYRAFRRRRSLLLLHYQSQVRLEELPWIAAIESARVSSPEAEQHALRTTQQTCAVALSGFPQTITPNKLVTELDALARAAGHRLPFVEELAADIFMGSFTEKFLKAAQLAAGVLSGSLYERYYAIDYAAVARLPAPTGRTSNELAALCFERAGKARGGVAANGKIIEQAQILTTHNLALLFDALAIRPRISPRDLAQDAFGWIVRRLRSARGVDHRVIKNAAFAWRQLVFFLSFADDVGGFVPWAREQLVRTVPAFQTRFKPVLRGLDLAIRGVRSDAPEFTERGGRVLLGWTTEQHWLAS